MRTSYRRLSDSQFHRADPELLESIPLVVLCLNADQRVVYSNPWASRVLGIPRDVLQNEAYLELHPDESDSLRGEFAQMVADGSPSRIGPRSAEFRVRRLDGEWRWLRAAAAAYQDANGSFRVATVSEDITELRAIQRRYATEDASAATFTIDLENDPPVVIGVDQEFERISGFGREELVGLTVPNLFARLHEPGKTELIRMLCEARLGREGNAQIFWQATTGVDMRAKLRIAPIAGRSQPNQLAVGVISSSRPAGAESAAAQARISDRLLSLGRFAMGLTHELNNPLGAILLSTERAAHMSRDERLNECLTEVVREVKRCGDIVRSLYRFARGEKSSLTLCDINQLVRCAVDTHRGVDPDLRVKTLLMPDLPMLMLDPVGIELALVNLIRNAREATDDDSAVEISTAISHHGVEIRIADRGCSIRKEDRGHIFEPFYSTRLSKGGSGIGLSVVHGIVSGHRGVVQVEVREGGGTIATIWLPDDPDRHGVAA
jgi:PAS domain S-box-containing protein